VADEFGRDAWRPEGKSSLARVIGGKPHGKALGNKRTVCCDRLQRGKMADGVA
jgi:hypothetical protein